MKDLYEKTVKKLEGSVIRRTIATTLILSLLGTQMPLSSVAGFGSSENGRGGSQTGSNAVSPARGGSGGGTGGESGDVDNDEDDNLIFGKITIMDDGTTDLSDFDEQDLRLYVNGKLATASNSNIVLVKDGSFTATGSNAGIPLIYDLGEEETGNSGQRNIVRDGFTQWYWYVAGVPLADEDGNTYEYSIRDVGYNPDDMATPDNASRINGYALFYTDEDGDVVDPGGDWGVNARNLVYVQKRTMEGDFEAETGALPLGALTALEVTPYEDEDYSGDAHGWIDEGEGKWYIDDALMYNPQTGETIVWRAQAVAEGERLISYRNIGDHEAVTDYICEGGTIINCNTTCQVTGTITWIDETDKYGKRPSSDDFILKITDAEGNPVADDVTIVIEAEGSDADKWNYTISNLSVNGIYTLTAETPEGYYITPAAGIQFTAVADMVLSNDIEVWLSTPRSVFIEAKVEGLDASDEVTLVYTLLVEEEGEFVPYTGDYIITYDHGTEKGKGSTIWVDAGQAVSVTFVDTDEDTQVKVTNTPSEDSKAGVLYITTVVDDGSYVLYYSVLKSVEVCIVWNDNNNQNYVRPYEYEEYLAADMIHLYFQVGDEERKYDLSDPADLADALARLGLTDWDGFITTSYNAAEWYYSAAGLPVYALAADGTIAEVTYWITVEDVEGYITTDKGWTIVPDVRADSWKFIYTSETELAFKVLWLDDNAWNNTRPDVATWKETVTLYQVSTNTDLDSADRTNTIDLSEYSFTVVESEDGKTWEAVISGLPEYDEDGYPYTYYLVQGEPDPNDEDENYILNTIDGEISYDAVYSNTGNHGTRTDACYQDGVIKNTLTGKLDFSATKVWVDGDRPANERPSVVLTLWRYTKGTPSDADHSYVAAVQVRTDMDRNTVKAELVYNAETGNYEVAVTGNLPAFDEDGHEYIYFVRESLSGNKASQYTCEIENDEAFSEQAGYDTLIFTGGIFTNRLTEEITVNVKKTWIAKALQGMDEATITVELQRRLVSEKDDDDAWAVVTDGDGNVVSKTIGGFKAEALSQNFSMGTWTKYDEGGYEYEYRVVETGVSLTVNGGTAEAGVADFKYDPDAGNYTSTYSFEINGEVYSFKCVAATDANGNTTIDNQLEDETFIEVHKYWQKTAYDDVDVIHLHVYRNGEDICEELGAERNHPVGFLEMELNTSTKADKTENYYQWSEIFSGFPKYDESGAEYVYSIKESVYSGKVEMWYGDPYGTGDGDHYGVDIWNGYGGTEIPVVKNWLDDGDVLHREQVTVGLYSVDDINQTILRELVLNKSNVWSGYFNISGLPDTDVGAYAVKEISLGTHERNNIDWNEFEELETYYYNNSKAYIQTNEHIYQVTEYWDGKEGKWVVENLRIGTIDIHLEKKWVAGKMEDPEAYTATFGLLRNSEPQDAVHTQRLEYSLGTWKASFTGLPKYGENGVLYHWKPYETGFTVPAADETGDYRYSLSSPDISYGDISHTGDVYSYTATNTRSAPATIRFHKIWKDNNGIDGVLRPDIYLKLYYAVDKNENGMIDAGEATDRVHTQVPAITADGDYHWIISYSLPRYNSAGYPYIYYAEEGMPARVSGGWQTVYLDPLADPASGEYDRTISLADYREDYMLEDGIAVNYREASTYVNGNKIWKNMGNNIEFIDLADYPYGLITLTLYSAILGEDGQPKLNSNGEPYVVLENGEPKTTKIVYNLKTKNFTYNFGELPKYDDDTGALICYYVKETMEGDDVGGFQWEPFVWNLNGSDFTLTNTWYNGQEMTLLADKVWDFGAVDIDKGDPANYPKVTFTLYRKQQELHSDGSYSDLYPSRVTKVAEQVLTYPVTVATFSNLPYYGPNGHPYRYYIEEGRINGYDIYVTIDGETVKYNSEADLGGRLASDSDAQPNEITITNKFTEERVKIRGTKNWSKDSGWDIRPEGIELKLWRRLSTQSGHTGVEVPADIGWTKNDNSWTYEFKETTHPFYRYTTTGAAYVYYVTETAIPGYTAPSSFFNGTQSTISGTRVFTINITNTMAATDLTVEKIWQDSSNKYGTRPQEIKVQLRRQASSDADYSNVTDPATTGTEWIKTLNAGNNWTVKFEDLPKYKVTAAGVEEPYNYWAVEVSPDGGYASAGSTVSGKTTITNTLKSGGLSVEKGWDDGDDQDGIRPQEVVVYLYHTTDIDEDGVMVYEDGESEFTLDAARKWRYEWSGLPTHSSDGKEYYYYVVEKGTGEEPLVRYQVTYSSSIKTDGGSAVVSEPQEERVTVTPATDSGSETCLVITNTYEPKEMTISVKKAWVGGDGSTSLTNTDILPATIIWQLQSRFAGEAGWTDVAGADGQKVADPGADYDYPAAWSNLPIKGKDASGSSRLIEYRVEEIKVAGYETAYSYGDFGVSGDIYEDDDANNKIITVMNKLTATTQVEVKKTWNDNLEGYDRADEVAAITFKLQRKLAGSTDVFEDVDEGEGDFAVTQTIPVWGNINTYSCVFENLPRYDNWGHEYAYRAVEASITLTPQYNSAVVYASGNDISGTIGGYIFNSVYGAAEDGEIADMATGSNVSITNTLSRRKVAVEKVWDDEQNQDGVRPTGVVVELLHDGEPYVPAKRATLSSANEWKHEWENLPEKHANGTPFEYSVAEIVMQGLDESQWGPDNGYAVSYSDVSTSQLQDLTVTNERTPATTEYKVYKYWADSDEYAGYDGHDWSAERPDSIQVQLYSQVNQGDVTVVENVGLVTLYAEARDGHDAWTYTWTGLPKYARVGGVETADGTSWEIQYSVKEVLPADGSGYVAVIDGNQITNQLKTTQLTVTKEWEDQNNYYDLRPQTITIQLQRSVNGTSWQDVAGVSQELDVHDSTQTCTFIGLPIRDKDNNPWQYRAVETYMDDVKVISHAASGYKVTYEHEPNHENAAGVSEPGETVITNTLETVGLTGQKVWEDQGNHYGARPESVKLTLKSSPEDALAEGLLEALVPTWSKNGNTWTYTYAGLPKYMADGKTSIVYSVVETVDAVYEVSYDAAHKNLTNTMKTGALAVTKIQEGGYSTDFTFRVKLDINDRETLYTGAYTVLESGAAWNESGEVRQTDESGAIVIRRDQQFVITGLPASAAYVVTEASKNQFTLISTVADTGVIPYQDAATASFKNKYTGGGDSGDDPKPPNPVGPTSPTSPTMPTTPTPPPVLPPVSPDHNLVPNGDGSYYELDDNGVALGRWHQDEDGTWIFDEEVPLAGLAKTGEQNAKWIMLLMLMSGLGGAVLVYKRRKDKDA